MLKKCVKRIGFKYLPYSFDNMITRQYNYLKISFVARPLDDTEYTKEPPYATLRTYNEYSNYTDDDISGLSDIHGTNNSGVNTILNVGNVDSTSCNGNDNNRVDNIGIKQDIPKKEGLRNPIEYPDDLYVLSKHFYKQNTKFCGVMENALLRYLRAEVQDTNELDNMIKFYPVWSTRDQYFLLPILLVLIKDAINNTFKGI